MRSIFHVHKVSFFGFILAAMVASRSAVSEELPAEPPSEEPTQASKEIIPAPKTPEAVKETKAESVLKSPTNTMGFNIRIDGSYSGGGAVSQGFSIPSIRLSGFGQVGKYLDYRLSLGQTREFSTASLAQVLPVEAYVVFNVMAVEKRADNNLRLKAGLFSPSFNPVWTPDLSYLNLPDFNATHRALFLSREAGGEVSFEAFNHLLEVSVGAFNGTGVFAENTNNAKAFTAFASLNVPLNSWKLSLGTGNYILNQSVEGSVNYKKSWASDVFLVVEVPELRSQIAVDAFLSHFEQQSGDSIRGISPYGGAAVLNLGLGGWLGLFGRYEYATKSPVLSGEIRQFQLGPEIYFDENVKAFVTYTQLTSGGAKDKMVTARFRLSL